MMLPVSRLKGHQPVAMVTAPWPSLVLPSEAPPPCLWFAGHSGGWYDLRPRPLYYPAPYWTPPEVSVVRWELPGWEMVPLLPPLYHSSLLLPPAPPPLPKVCWRSSGPKLVDGWIYPEDLAVFPQPTNQIPPRRHTPRTRPLLSPVAALLGGAFRELAAPLQWHKGAWSDKRAGPEREACPVLKACPERQVSPVKNIWSEREAWPIKRIVFPVHLHKEAGLSHFISQDRWPRPLFQVMSSLPVSLLSRKSSAFTLLTNLSPQNKRGGAGAGGCGRGTVMTNERETDEEGVSEVRLREVKTDRRPVATTPVPGSPWCVVWTGDDRVFFFNPTMHLSVWERPCDLIGQDIGRIIMDPPHKRKKNSERDLSCHDDDDDDDDDEDGHDSKRSRLEEPLSLIKEGQEDKLLPLEMRVSKFRDMMLERGVSAFSSWEKDLHKMVFDPRYLLLSPDQRKEVYDQFVKSRIKEEYKEKKTKLLKAKDQFKLLLEEAKITSNLEEETTT
ncbi:transcription elongation regulator 1-like protein isoform X2 [Gadus morhua]|uniref:transcription elongation regulator 1-like protein isoform X2 n=1 Tax=Gadus morhua TaxID=8049 RepID=UPI0011B3C0F3|nr:transcription elongation regulator 1-like protein isoform X2 [Gadus morhua]